MDTLKYEFQTLEKLFPKNHKRFQILNCNVDELFCRFIDQSGKHHDISAYITDKYPSRPPAWFTESADPRVENAVKKLSHSHTDGWKNHMIDQVGLLLRELCLSHNVPLPSGIDIDSLTMEVHHPIAFLENFDPDSGNRDCEPEAESIEDLRFGVKNLQIADPNIKVDPRNLGSVSGSAQATDRLMKELRDIYRSDTFKQKMYSIELVNDSIYEWNITLISVDSDSQLHNDLLQLKKREGTVGIQLSVLFGNKYPSEPPFVRIVHPIIFGGYVQDGGAICMELLTRQGWNSAYSVEALIVQIAATMVKGGAYIQPGATKELSQVKYTLDRAKLSFKLAAETHEVSGWGTLRMNEG